MARLFIPQVGNQLKLTANWNCKVFNERRNSKVFSGLNVDTSSAESRNTNIDITFPKGTILKVDRLYVRAPASSYDSITFSIVSSPIKSLNKARFWVKIMDANNIEFEEIVLNMDFHKKIKDLHRYVALKNNFQNSERLSAQESTAVNKEIFDHFSQKNNNVLKTKFTISAEGLAKTITFENHREYGFNREKYPALYEDALAKIKKEFGSIEINLDLVPVLDGWAFHFPVNEQAIKIDKILGFYKKEYNYYGTSYPLGSYLSLGYYYVFFEAKMFPKLLDVRLDDTSISEVTFEYQEKLMTFKNRKEFDNFIKSIRPKIEK